MRSLSIRTRVFLATLFVLLVFSVAGSLVLERMVDRVLEREMAESAAGARTASERFLALELELLESQVRSVAQVPRLRAVLGTPDIDGRTLRETVRSLEAGPRLFLTAPTGEVLVAPQADPPPAAAELAGWDRVLAGETWAGLSSQGGRPRLLAVAPVSVGGTLLGALGAVLPLDESLVGELSHAVRRQITLLAPGAPAVACRCAAGERNGPQALVRPLADWVARSQEGSTVLAANGAEYVVTAFPLGADGATLVVSRALDAVLAPYRDARRRLAWTGLGVAVAALAVALHLSRRMGRPIQQLTRAAVDLASGRLDTAVEVRGDDEVALLGRQFNRMADQIRTLVGQAVEKAQVAEAANEAKSHFLSTMGHEVRTPLNAVLGFADALLGTELDPERREQVRAIREAGDSLLEIVGDILDYTDLEAGELEFEEHTFELETLLERVMGPAVRKGRRQGLAVATRIADDVPRRLSGRTEALHRVLSHSVDNALKFTPHGSVTLAVGQEPPDGPGLRLRFAVRDTGVGIPAHAREQVFAAFEQADSSLSRRFGGTGLGLTICRDLVALLGGRCGLDSAVGVGTTFWFVVPLEPVPDPATPRRVPRAAPRAAAPNDRSPSAPDGAGGASGSVPSGGSAPAHERGEDPRERRAGQRILLVEDNPLNQKVATLVLRKAGFRYDVAEHGAEALEKLAHEDFDLVLMDCQMPVMDGFEATRRVRERESGSPRRLPIVALTANALRSDEEACMAVGMDDFVAKPFQAGHLIEVLDHWLGAPAEPSIEAHRADTGTAAER